MKGFRVEVTEVHEVVIETEAKDADEACEKVENGEWDDNTFVVDDQVADREVHGAQELEDEEVED